MIKYKYVGVYRRPVSIDVLTFNHQIPFDLGRKMKYGGGAGPARS